MKKRLFTIFTMLFVSCLVLTICLASAQQKISKPGEYSGYSSMLYEPVSKSYHLVQNPDLEHSIPQGYLHVGNHDAVLMIF